MYAYVQMMRILFCSYHLHILFLRYFLGKQKKSTKSFFEFLWDKSKKE